VWNTLGFRLEAASSVFFEFLHGHFAQDELSAYICESKIF